MITLSQQERDKFIIWLEQEAKSEDGIIKQLETMPGHEMLIKRIRSRAIAYLIVANDLRNTETVTL